MLGVFDVPVAGAYHVVLGIAGWVHPAIAIVVVTIGVRALLHPLARAAARGERRRVALAPKIKALQEKYRGERLRRELAELQREGATMFAGCLPVLAQAPFFIVMYRMFSVAAVGGAPNVLLASTVFGTPLGAHIAINPVFGVLIVGLAAVAWWSGRLMKPGPLRLLPYGSILAALIMPLAGGIYLLTSNVWATAERVWLRGGDGEPTRR